jgi:uncharacterized protein
MAAAREQNIILLAGGSGLIGRALAEKLRASGRRVRTLSRARVSDDEPDRFFWDPERDFLNPEALRGVSVIINLAGANIGEKKWSARRKEEIIASRVKSHAAFARRFEEEKLKPALYISASAIGYYGARGAETLTEDSAQGRGFLAETTAEWEKAAARTEAYAERAVRLRIGVVLARTGGALEKMALPVRMYAGAPLGDGRQYMSWIHIDDLCAMIQTAIADETWRGIYNAVAPQAVTNLEMTQAIARTLHRPLFLPAVPAGALQLMLGEMAALVLDSARVSPARALEANFSFQFPHVDAALADLLR